MKDLLEIEAEVHRFAQKIGASGYVLPTFGKTEDSARPHIEVDALGYHYVVVERGQELRRDTTFSLDELLYWAFESVTFALACDYELSHRLPSPDSRRLLFAHQLKLLSVLSPLWAERERCDHERILQQHPFSDR